MIIHHFKPETAYIQLHLHSPDLSTNKLLSVICADDFSLNDLNITGDLVWFVYSTVCAQTSKQLVCNRQLFPAV